MASSALAVIAGAVIGGLLSAALYLSVLAGPAFLLLQYVTQLPLFVVGLGLGLGPMVIAGTVAALAALLADTVIGVMFVIGYAVPAALATRQALLSRVAAGGKVEWYPPGLLLANITGYAVLVLALAMLWFSGRDGGLAGVISGLIALLAPVLGSDAPATDGGTIARYAFLAPGLVGLSWIIMVAVNGALAQSLLKGFARNLRPTPAFVELTLPDWPAYLLGAAALLWLLGGGGSYAFAGGAMVLMLMTPFLFQGLAVIHQWARRSNAPVLYLVVLYFFLLLLQWPMVAVAALGLIDQWADFRRRGASR